MSQYDKSSFEIPFSFPRLLIIFKISDKFLEKQNLAYSLLLIDSFMKKNKSSTLISKLFSFKKLEIKLYWWSFNLKTLFGLIIFLVAPKRLLIGNSDT